MKLYYQALILFLLSLPIFGQNLIIDSKGHSSLVRGISFTNDNSKIISVSEDKTIRIWDVKKNQLSQTLWGEYYEGKEGRYNALAIHPTKNIIAVAGFLHQNEIRIIDIETSTQIASLKGHQNIITELHFSNDGQWLCSGSADKTARIWFIPQNGNTSPKQTIKIDGFSEIVYSVDFSEDGNQLVCGTFDGAIKLYDLSMSKDKATLKNEWNTMDKITKVKFSSDKLIVGGAKGNVYVYTLEGVQEAQLTDASGYITNIELPNSEKECLIVDSKGNLMIYNTENWLKNRFISSSKGIISAAKFANNNDNYVVYAKGVEGHISIYDIKNKKTIRQFESEGMSNKRIGRGENLNFSLSINKASRKPYNKVFDFENLEMHLTVDDQSKYTMPDITYQGSNLKRLNNYTLQTGNASHKITNDKQRDKGINAYNFTKSGDVVVCSGNSLKLYSNEGTLIREFKGHHASVLTANVSDDGKYLISSSDDQTTKLWNISSGELLASLFVSAHNEWVCWSPKGYYHASAGGEKYIGWIQNNGLGNLANFQPVSFADKRYHKKEVLQEIIKEASHKNAFQKLNIKELDPKELVKEQPNIEWVSPKSYHNLNGEEKVQLTATVKSKTKLKSLKLLVDGRPKSVEIMGTENSVGQTIYAINETLDINNSETKIQIFAENEFTKVTSNARSVIKSKSSSSSLDVGFDLAALTSASSSNEKSKQNIYLLSIGISDYQNKTLNLNYADKDALSIADIYKKQSNGKLFNQVHIKELTNEAANKQNILEGFKWLSENATSKDLAIVFIASHGVNWENNFYIIPHDIDLENVDKTGVKWNECASVMTNLPSQVLLFVDACNSGQLGVDISHSDNTESIRQLSSDENGVIIMSGSTGVESSLESSEWQHGAFTAAILDGLGEGKADYSGDQVITLRELDLFIAMKVEELTKGKQHPTTQKPSTISVVNVGEMVQQ
ncbi:caspase family protein [Flammeovirga pacifica]|uniref:Peptidase C14 caspase domain-containing protein n=1 Tax=Flammeovirga pacifica TaxID=915059 RepID=A0A1S1YT51_FLAPC|nr:caspase family protein [Flammeovirga pacifica]OHX64200.1 hypothetical protein NH26_21590 [Flammeovirga pacifica]